MRVVIEDHTVSVELLDGLKTFGVAVAELIFVLVFGNSWELKHLNLLRCPIILLEHLVSDIEVECNEVTGVQLLRLLVVGYVNQWYHRDRVLFANPFIQFIVRVIAFTLVPAALQPKTINSITKNR